MPPDPQKTVYYKQARFSTRLPVDRLYTPSHCWIEESSAGLWRVGLTKFATRMLGDLVEFEFSAGIDDSVDVGQSIGWIEGFKALSDIYCVMAGQFRGGNDQLLKTPSLFDNDSYGHGWLYEVQGEPDERAVDVNGYIAVLDATIDRMLNDTPSDQGEENCPKPGTS